MDITFNPVSGTSPQHPATAVKAATSAPTGTDTTTIQAQAAAPFAAVAPAAFNATQEAAVRQVALSFKNVYALGDQQFSIFKDATGKYITRYVSLRDGKITYLPEPTVVRPLQLDAGPAGTPTHVAISA